MGNMGEAKHRRAGNAGNILLLGLVGFNLAGWSQGWHPTTNLTLNADLTLRESYDDNIYLQNVQPSPTVPNAVKPYQDSAVTSITPRVALDWKPMKEFNLTTFYAPEIVTYSADSGENYVSHRGALTFSGQVGVVQWEQFNTVTYIDGNHEGLTFGGPPLPSAGITGGNAPAIGGIPIRDRRAALIYRNGFRALHTHGNFFFRPVAWSYVHDFHTEQRTNIGYQNYVDRNDFAVGMEVGYKAFRDAYLVVGYRYGFQDEPPLPWSPIDYSNTYNRFVFGFEGTVTSWLKITGLVGPDYRDFTGHTPPGFNDHPTVLYYDATIVVTPTKQDTFTVLLRQFEQPAFGNPSVYEDITWDLLWRHQFSAKFSVTTGFRAYGGDWVAPVAREDWIYTPSILIRYAPTKHFIGEVSYTYDRATTRVPNTSGREYTRNLVSLGLKYAF
jgi:hypothetical protein